MHFIDLAAQQRQTLQDGLTIREAVDSPRFGSESWHTFLAGGRAETVLSSYVGVNHCMPLQWY